MFGEDNKRADFIMHKYRMDRRTMKRFHRRRKLLHWFDISWVYTMLTIAGLVIILGLWGLFNLIAYLAEFLF